MSHEALSGRTCKSSFLPSFTSVLDPDSGSYVGLDTIDGLTHAHRVVAAHYTRHFARAAPRRTSSWAPSTPPSPLPTPPTATSPLRSRSSRSPPRRHSAARAQARTASPVPAWPARAFEGT